MISNLIDITNTIISRLVTALLKFQRVSYNMHNIFI